MTFFSRIAAAALAALVGTAAFAAPTMDDPVALEAFVDGVVEPLMKNNNSPSGVVAIAKDGELIFAKGYGYQDIDSGKAVDPYTTLFRPGSVSKLFTWVSVMQLVEQGKLDLDTDVNEYLDSVEIPDTFDEPITLRHIMTHTAGFEDGALGYLIIDDPERAVPLKEAMSKYRQERVNPPGKQTAYSNYATALAGLIVANVSGESFEDYVHNHIFEPLGMSNATFEEPLPAELADKMATSYAFENGDYVEKPFEIVASFGPAGGQSASATDMVRFAQAILNGGELDGQRILSEATVREQLSDQFSHDERLMGMGLGFYATDLEGHRVMGHGGDTQWFHSYLGIDAENGLAFFVSFAATGGRIPRSSLTPALYAEYFPRQDAMPEPPADFATRAGRYAGDYGFWRSNFSKIEKSLGLSGGVKVYPVDNELVVAFSGKAKRYVEIEENLFRESNPGASMVPGISPRQIAFQEDGAGNITGFVMDGLPFMSLRRLATYETAGFNFMLLGLSLLVFALVLLKRFYQRERIRKLPAADRSAIRAATWCAAANWIVVIAGVVTISAVQDRLFSEVPGLFKAWLVLPILAAVAGAWLLVKLFAVWRGSLLEGAWARIRYLGVTLCGLFMIWFYWFWNILGFQYLA
ncbi:serine hydrolase domain-containing protein [Marinihelvus fidelis]|nr:serine hydrolase domain-containing protein [Marinihelvus fidelis]